MIKIFLRRHVWLLSLIGLLFLESILVVLILQKNPKETQTAKRHFQTGQAAELMLSGVGFNQTGGALLFNHPSGIASDGQRLILADRNNNRVLIWNELPTENVEPDIVLGQRSFETNEPGRDLDQLNWPIGVATDGTRLLVADTYNDRILVWLSFPDQSGTPADFALETWQHTNQNGSIAWPWAVWTNGTKVVVTSTLRSQALIWNTFPTRNKQPDVILANESFGTPRSIASDGAHLVVGDHNAYKKDAGTFFWKTFPSTDNQPFDFFVKDPGHMDDAGTFIGGATQWLYGPTMTNDGKLLGLTNHGFYLWNTFPINAFDGPDVILSQPSSPENPMASINLNGDGSGVVVAEDRVYVSLANANKIVGFESISFAEDAQPDFVIGSPDFETNTLDTHHFLTNPIPASDGKHLLVTSDFDRTLSIWNTIPESSGTTPDRVMKLDFAPWDSAIHKSRFALAGQNTVEIWETLPLAGQKPDRTFQGSMGSVRFSDLVGVAMDEHYFYLADRKANAVFVWEGLPESKEEPLVKISIQEPGRLTSDGKYLATVTLEGRSVWLMKIENVSRGNQSAFERLSFPKEIGPMNLPQGVEIFNGQLFVADTGFNRVLVWEDVEDAKTGSLPSAVLGVDSKGSLEHITPQIKQDRLFWPATLSFDGESLWIGEFKFSGRLLKFTGK